MVGIPRLSIVNVVGSAIARETKMGVYLNAGRETAVASTKAFTTQVGHDYNFYLINRETSTQEVRSLEHRRMVALLRLQL